MGDVEEGEIVEVDFNAKSPRPPIWAEHGNQESLEPFGNGADFWPERRKVESFDYNHGYWMDRGLNTRALRGERYANAPGGGGYFNDRRGGHSGRQSDKQQGYYREERLRSDVDWILPQKHRRIPYFGRKRRLMPQRMGFLERKEYQREGYRNYSRELAANDLQSNDFRQAGYHHFNRPVDGYRRLLPINLREREVSKPASIQHEQGGVSQLYKEEDFLAKFERVDKSREENLRQLERKDMKRNDDEYSMDDYELLLERHRLIQQQLTAIGQRERNIKKRMQNEIYHDDFSDFEVVPNPNSPGDASFVGLQETCGTLYKTFEEGGEVENKEENFKTSEAEMTRKHHLDSEQENINQPFALDYIHQNWSEDLSNNESNHCLESSIYAEPVNDENSLPSQATTEPPQVLENKAKKRKRRQRKSRFKLRPNHKELQRECLKTLEEEHGMQSEMVLDEIAGQSLSSRKKTKIEVLENEDNYQSIPMDLEDEYEEIDSFVEDDYDSKLTQEMEDQGPVEEPPLQVREASEEETTTLEEPAPNQSDTPAITATSQEDMEDVKDEVEEEMEDDLLLREQLLQSLATKRAEKARAIIANQQTRSSTPQSDVPNATEKQQHATVKQQHATPKEDKQFKRPESAITTSVVAKTNSIAATATSSFANNHRRDQNIVKYQDKASFLGDQQKLVIQIGADTDSDHDYEHEQAEDHDFFGGAINDLIREARHGTETQSESQSSTPKKQQKDNFKDSNLIQSNGDELLHENFERCISNANKRILSNREQSVKETNAIKLLQKKIALRKSRIEQHDTKIAKLKQLLATSERSKKTLNAQCVEFQTKIKLLTHRIDLRRKKSSELEEEMQRAKSMLSAASVKNHILNSPRRTPDSGNSPVRGEHSKGAEAKTLLAEQINKSIAKMKLVLAKHEQSVSAGLLKERKSMQANSARMSQRNSLTKAKSKPPSGLKSHGNSSEILMQKSENTLQSEKDRLQKLERALRLKLDHMKRLSEAKQRIAGKTGPKRNENVGKKGSDVQGKNVNDATEKAPFISTAKDTNTKEGSLGRTFTTKTDLDMMDCNKNMDKKENNERDAIKTLAINDENDLREVIQNRVENKLSTLFQDEEKLKKIKQDQLDREAKAPDLQSYHPHSITDLGKVQNLEREKESFDDVIQNDRIDRDAVKSCRDIDSFKDFSIYKSSLVLFRSYRLSPWFRSQEMKAVTSNTYSNGVNPIGIVCPYDLSGKCLDGQCNKQHSSDSFSLNDDRLLMDLVHYEPRLASIMPKDSAKIRNEKVSRFITRLKQKYGDKIGKEKLAVLLINDMRLFRKQKQKSKVSQVFNVCFEKRQERGHVEERPQEKILVKSQTGIVEQQRWKKDLKSGKAESQELRYFEEHYDIRKTLEKSVNDNPADIKSWSLLAKQVASDSKNGHDESLSDKNLSDREDQVLNVLSKALEANPYSEDLWIMYLEMFSKRHNSVESREMYIQALEYCRSYTIWWKCLELEKYNDDKMEICLDMIDFLRNNPENLDQDLKSHRLLETILYMVKLELMRGRKGLALRLLQSALNFPMDPTDIGQGDVQVDLPALVDDLTVEDTVVAWLCLISISQFDQLLPTLFDPAIGGPSKIVSKDIGLLNWDAIGDREEVEIRRIFEDASKSLPELTKASEKDTEALVSFYANFIQFEIHVGHLEKAVDIATHCTAKLASQLTSSPVTSSPVTSSVTSSPVTSSVTSPAMTSLMLIKMMDRNLSVLRPDIISQLDHLVSLKTDECVYNYAKYLLKTNTSDHAVRLLVDSVARKFDFNDGQADVSLEIGFKAEAISFYKRLLRCSTNLTVGSRLPKKTSEVDEKSREYAFIWLNLCLLQELTSAAPDSNLFSTGVEEALESAVNAYTTRENREILWLEYLDYKERLIKQSSLQREDVKLLFEVAKRCLACMPSSRALPYQSSIYWDDYSFHNKVISKCLQFLPESDGTQYLRTTFTIMPNNLSLALWLCHAAITNDNFEDARTIYGIILEAHPLSLEMWKMAIAVELKSKKVREARWLYEEATRMLPYSNSLWEEFVLFEIGHGQNPRQIQTRIIEIATKATSYGIFIMDYVKNLLK